VLVDQKLLQSPKSTAIFGKTETALINFPGSKIAERVYKITQLCPTDQQTFPCSSKDF